MWRGLGWGVGAKRGERKVSTDTDTVTEGEDEDEEEIFDLHPSIRLAGSCTVRLQRSSATRLDAWVYSGGRKARRGAAPQGIMSWMKRSVTSKMKTPTPTPKR